MAEHVFQNFDLLIEKSGEKYRVRVVESPAGEASGEFNLPFSTTELDDFIVQMGKPVQGAQKSDSAELGAIKKFGEMLFNAVFTKDIFACYLSSLAITNKLRVRLRLEAPELHNLPWEYLYIRQRDLFLAQSNDTPIIRYFNLPYSTQAPKDPPLKILVMISSPDGYPKLDVEQHWNRLSKALGGLIGDGLVVLERLESPTLDKLQEALSQEDVDIFHFIGHGKYMEHSQEGKLLIEDENGKGIPVDGKRLGTLLQDSDSLQLVVLNACEGARTSSEDPYAGVAQTLVKKGIQSVIAMQFEIFENAAIKFAQKFYETLVLGKPVDVALSEARKAIFASGNDREWGTPVLFSRSPDSVLFQPVDTAHKTDAEKVGPVTEPAAEQIRTRASGTSLSTLLKNPKALYVGIFLVLAVLAVIFGLPNINKPAQTVAPATSTVSQADTATAVQSDSLAPTQESGLAGTATAVMLPEATQTEIVLPAPTSTSAGTPTPVTPPLDCLDRWSLIQITEDTPLSAEPASENGCVTAYKDLGIFASSAGLSYLQKSFRVPGNFGITTPLPKNPQKVSLTLKLYDISGGGQGEFWIALSNDVDPEQDSVSIAIQPKGPVKYYVNGEDMSRVDNIEANPLPYLYKIELTIDGTYVDSVVNSAYYQNNLPVASGPKYLFIGYKKRSNQGTVNIQVDITSLEIE